MSIRIDKEFESLIPPLSDEEFAQLEENCLKEGIRDALVVWKVPNGDMILVDGHNRLKISAKHGGLPFQIKEMQFDLREDAIQWIIQNQLGRRNLPDYVKAQLALRLKPLIAEQAKKRMSDGAKGVQISAQAKGKTRDDLAKAAGVSHDTIHKVETIENSGNEFIKQQARKGEISINSAYNAVKGYDKSPAQRQKEFMDSIQKEHEEFQEKKAESVVNVADIQKDKANQKIIARDLYDRCLKMSKPIFELHFDMNEKIIDMSIMYTNITAEQKTELLRHIDFCRRVLTEIEQGVNH